MFYYRSERKGFFILRLIGGLIMGGIAALFFGLIIMWLWNWLMPTLFELPSITYWQGWGLVVLTHILFKSFPNCPSRNPHHKDEEWKHYMRTKFKKKYEEKYGGQEESGSRPVSAEDAHKEASSS